MAELTDTDRINAIAEDGFSIICEAERTAEGWRETWHCSYKLDEKFGGENLREAMDKAIINYRNESTKGVQNELL